MAMILRLVLVAENTVHWKAFCANEVEHQQSDIYLDDSQDHAIREKLMQDFISEGLIDPNWDKPAPPKEGKPE